MEPELQAILLRAHNNGGTVRLQNIGESRLFIIAFERGYIVPEYDYASIPSKYLHHVITNAGREALIAAISR